MKSTIAIQINLRFYGLVSVFALLIILFNLEEVRSQKVKTDGFYLGWASADITPTKPVLIAGQFHARMSEGIMDHIMATALAIESVKEGNSAKAIMISCDLVGISDGSKGNSNIIGRVRELLKDLSPALMGENIMINATHTHAAPVFYGNVESTYGVGLDLMAPGVDVMSPEDYAEFAAIQIAKAARQAWTNRKPGGISVGLSHAVIGHNRLQVERSGKSIMYGNTNRLEFDHIEGFEDHSLNLLYTWDNKSNLTGVIVNATVPSQVSEHSYLISADFWHETRVKIRERMGKDIFVLSQAGSAGDQSPHLLLGGKAEERMQRIMGLDKDGVGRGSLAQRKQIAIRITDAVYSIFPYMKKNIEWNPVFAHKMETIQLSRRLLSLKDVEEGEQESIKWKKEYEQMLTAAKASPTKMKEPRWYRDVTINYSKMKRGLSVRERYELEKKYPKFPIEVHVLRIGDMAIASNPFELYLDYGTQIQARSPAIQTFIVQLSGGGTYLPTKRSIAGGAYGAVPASTLIGPEGGQELVEQTLKIINSLWQ
jgi:hypothetical protein